MRKRTEYQKREDGQLYRIVKGTDESVEAAEWAVAAELERTPDGYHVWRVQWQRSDRGRRASWAVWFRATREKAREPMGNRSETE